MKPDKSNNVHSEKNFVVEIYSKRNPQIIQHKKVCLQIENDSNNEILGIYNKVNSGPVSLQKGVIYYQGK